MVKTIRDKALVGVLSMPTIGKVLINVSPKFHKNLRFPDENAFGAVDDTNIAIKVTV